MQENEASDAILNTGIDALRFIARDPAWAFATCVVEMGRVMTNIEFKHKRKGRTR